MKLTKKEIKQYKATDLYTVYKYMDLLNVYDKNAEDLKDEAFTVWQEMTKEATQEIRDIICDIFEYIREEEEANDERDIFEQYDEYKKIMLQVRGLYWRVYKK